MMDFWCYDVGLHCLLFSLQSSNLCSSQRKVTSHQVRSSKQFDLLTSIFIFPNLSNWFKKAKQEIWLALDKEGNHIFLKIYVLFLIWPALPQKVFIYSSIACFVQIFQTVGRLHADLQIQPCFLILWQHDEFYFISPSEPTLRKETI